MGIFSLVEILYNNLNKGFGIVLPPLARGKASLFFEVPPQPGSPPLARGKVVGFSATGSMGGITPACAGKSLDIQ